MPLEEIEFECHDPHCDNDLCIEIDPDEQEEDESFTDFVERMGKNIYCGHCECGNSFTDDDD